MSYRDTIMAQRFSNRVRERRLERGWSQLELARRAGVSRTAVSAIEGDRLVPSVAAALALAAAFESPVEDLFGNTSAVSKASGWAWPPATAPCRYWHAEVQGRLLFYPVEANGLGTVPHDGVFVSELPPSDRRGVARETLVMAGCDPAAGLLAAEFTRITGLRMLVLPRSSRQALDLLARGLVHVAGLHLSAAGRRDGNAAAVRERLGDGFRLLRIARWQEGLTVAPALRVRSVQAALRSKLSWIGREPGSGARQCLDELLHRRSPPRRIAYDHRGVAEAVRCGWAQIGVCVQLVSAEAGQQFLSVREESYDLCFPAQSESDPRVQALVRVVRSSGCRKLLGELPGYDTSESGEMETVN